MIDVCPLPVTSAAASVAELCCNQPGYETGSRSLQQLTHLEQPHRMTPTSEHPPRSQLPALYFLKWNVDMCTYTIFCAPTRMYTCTCMHMRSCTCTFICAYMHAYERTRTRVHKRCYRCCMHRLAVFFSPS